MQKVPVYELVNNAGPQFIKRKFYQEVLKNRLDLFTQ